MVYCTPYIPTRGEDKKTVVHVRRKTSDVIFKLKWRQYVICRIPAYWGASGSLFRPYEIVVFNGEQGKESYGQAAWCQTVNLGTDFFHRTHTYNILFYTTLSNFSTKYRMMCKVYTDVGGIK